MQIDFDYKVGGKVLLQKEGILRKSESRYDSDPWTITTVHTNGTIRVQRGSKSERINIGEQLHLSSKRKNRADFIIKQETGNYMSLLSQTLTLVVGNLKTGE